MFPLFTAIANAVSAFIPKLLEIVGKNLIQIANIIIGIVKGLGIVAPEENATDLGDKALQAEEAGIKPENYDSYEEYLKAVEKFETNPERSAQIKENEKLQKGAEIITATLIERYGDAVTALLAMIAKNPTYFEQRMPIFTEMQKSNSNTFADITRYMSGKETDIKKADETLEKIFEVEKKVWAGQNFRQLDERYWKTERLGDNMDLYMIIGKNNFYLYRRTNNGFEIEYIDGNPYRHYDTHTIKSDLANLLETVANTNNLDSANEIYFMLIENSDHIRNSNVEQFLENRVKEKISINDILNRAINSLAGNKDLHIGEFGINYDGSSYILRDGKLQQNPYSLLAYNVRQEELMKFI